MRYEEPSMECISLKKDDLIYTSTGGLNDNITDPDNDGIDLTFV